MASISLLKECAKDHLSDFVDPVGPWKYPARIGPRSFHTYDRQGDSAKFDSLDAFAPSLLDARLGPMEINQMFSGKDTDNPFNNLRVAIERCLTELASLAEQSQGTLDFADIDFSSIDGPWSYVNECYVASKKTNQIGYSKVSKMLHRKQPTFIPIIDSKLANFYGLNSNRFYRSEKVSRKELENYHRLFQTDFRTNRNFLNDLSNEVLTSEGNPVSSLRVADIIIWEHIATRCSGSTRAK
jgi:hypothetical protein